MLVELENDSINIKAVSGRSKGVKREHMSKVWSISVNKAE